MYKLIWPGHQEFVRMAAGAVGEDDISEVGFSFPLSIIADKFQVYSNFTDIFF